METVTETIIKEFIAQNRIELLSTHGKLCLPIINRIYKKMMGGIQFRAIRIDDRVICDGHHRFIASLFADYPLERTAGKSTSATQVITWNQVSFEEEDWDTTAKINLLNEQDAAYNNLSIERILEMLE